MAQTMSKRENRSLRRRLAKYGAVPMSIEGIMSKIRFGKLSSTKFVHMSLAIPEIKVSIQAFESLGRQRYADWFKNGGHDECSGPLDAQNAEETVEAALSLQVLTSVRAPLDFLGDTREFMDWMSLDFIVD